MVNGSPEFTGQLLYKKTHFAMPDQDNEEEPPNGKDDMGKGGSDDDDDEAGYNPTTVTTRSGRTSKPPERLNMFQQEADPDNPDNQGYQFYGEEGARVIAAVLKLIIHESTREAT